jgi:8-oxo-dGTP pyrophosphatase MutT (NUDIX family)
VKILTLDELLAPFIKLAGAGDAAAAAAALPGATIAQQAAAGAHAGTGSAHAAPRKVATALGAAHFKAPIGSLIIPHEHFIKGQPSHWSPDISQAKWVANQWKDRKGADEAAHKGVEAGTHRWVGVGKHEFAVHKALEVHVPKDTDVHDEAAVKNATKVFVRRDEHGKNVEHMTVGHYQNGKMYTAAAAASPGNDAVMDQSWKKLDFPDKPHKSVSFAGKHAAWVPHDWDVYKTAGKKDSDVAVKWVRSPQGEWKFIDKAGELHETKVSSEALEAYLRQGTLAKDDDQAQDHGVHPLQEGHQHAKVDVGGVAVTKRELQQAIAKLQGSKSTQIKGLLKGHPLEASDYHSVYKAELEKHPELKVPPGTKKAHVPEAKLAFIHHLAGRIQHLSGDQAESAAAEAAQDSAKAEAAHAVHLTPHTTEIPKEKPLLVKPGETAKLLSPKPPAPAMEHGPAAPESPEPPAAMPSQGAGTVDVTGIHATKEQVQEAIDALSATKSTAIKQILKAKGNPLQAADYWAVIHEYEAAHPAPKVTGTKQVHVASAKSKFIAALQEKQAGLAKADQLTGHDNAAALYSLAKDGTLKAGIWTDDATGAYAVAKAAKAAVKNGHDYYAYAPNGETWKAAGAKPTSIDGISYFRVTPQLKLYWNPGSGGPDLISGDNFLSAAMQKWLEPKAGEPPPAPEPLTDVLKKSIGDWASASHAKAWAEDPAWQKLHARVQAVQPGHGLPSLSEAEKAAKSDKAIVRALWFSSESGDPTYVSNVGGWLAHANPPEPGSYAANTSPWYEVHPDHRVIYHTPAGGVVPLGHEAVTQILREGTTPGTVLDSPPEAAPAQGMVPVWVAGHHAGDVPKGTKFYTGTGVQVPLGEAVKFMKYPDGSWHISYSGGPIEDTSAPVIGAKGDSGGVFEIPEEAAKGYVEVTQGTHSFWAPRGSALFEMTTFTKAVREPNGTWHYVDDYDGHGTYLPDEAKTMDAAASGSNPGTHPMVPLNDAAKQWASKHAPKPDHTLITPLGSPADGPKDLQVHVGDGVVAMPAGTEVYVSAKGTAAVKYAKKPDGSWWFVYPGALVTAPPGSQWDTLLPGNDEFIKETYSEAGQQVPGEPAPGEEPAQPQGVPAIFHGEVTGYYPPGSKLYHKTVGSYGGEYAKAPDGKWYEPYSKGVKEAAAFKASDKDLQGSPAAMEPKEPPSAEQLKNAAAVTKVRQLAKTGSVDQAKALKSPGSNMATFKTWQLAFLNKLATWKDETEITIVPGEAGGFRDGWAKDGLAEYWTIDKYDMSVRHYVDGHLAETLPPTVLEEAASRYVVPGSVVVQGKQYAFGFWKKPKGTAYLEVKQGGGGVWKYTYQYKYGTAAGATYWYHSAKGTVEQVSPAYAEKYLENGLAVHSASDPGLPPPPEPSKPTYAQVAVPGTYQMWSEVVQGPAEGHIEVKADGSAILSGKVAGAAVPVKAENLTFLIKGGGLLDQFGTTVVRPGTETETFHLFGGVGRSRAELEQLKADMEAGWENNWQQAVADFMSGIPGQSFTSYKNHDLGTAFMNKAGAVTGAAQRQAIYSLVKELLAVPKLPEGAKVAAETGPPKEVAYLKAMPEGIAKAADAFTWTQEGHAVPVQAVAAKDIYGLTSAEAKEKIKDISAQVAGGKLVGQHLSGLTKDEAHQWLTAWKQGDMAKVFAIDAVHGKVSPAHPGAPGNTGTHHVSWSPLDPHQVPAGKDIPGSWSSLQVELPPQEVANYLIKMGFQHAEYLHSYTQKEVVKAHRNHDQDTVDAWTKQANDAYLSGGTTFTQPPQWTEGLKPAHVYDAYLKNKTPASDWSVSATETFMLDNQAELAKFAPKFAQQGGYASADAVLKGSIATKEKLVQAYIDDELSKQVAAQMVPTWKKADAGALPSHTHAVYKAVQVIPYTGQTSEWFAKPAPGGNTWRLEEEHNANLLGRLFGFQSAESQILQGEPAFGEVVQVQRAIPGTPLGHSSTDLPAWSQFTKQEVADIAVEHLLDWTLSNDDNSANNMVRTPDGRLVGVDKGRSWADLKWDGLSGGASMNTRTQVVYAKLYDAIRGHQLSKDVADEAYRQVILRARKMAKVPDAQVRALAEAAFANRPKAKFDKHFPDKEALVQEVLRRKNNLEQDFRGMWAQVYKQAGFGEQKSDFGPGMPWGDSPIGNARYGTVVFNDKGQVLLREVKNHFAATAWTFAKGGQSSGESPLQAAIRETAEETKYQFTPVGYVPGAWTGTASVSYYYLATAKGSKFVPQMDNGETEQVKWATPDEAKALIAQSESEVVRQRDWGTLDAAVKAWGAGLYDAPALADPHGLGAALPDVSVQRLTTDLGGHQLYAGFNEPGFYEAAIETGPHGKPAFFGGPDLRDMHVLVWHHQDSHGQQIMNGETFMKGEGRKKAVEWLKQHSKKATAADTAPDTATTYAGTEGMPGYAPADSPSRGGVANEVEIYNEIIKAARTVTRHKADGKYNAAELAKMESRVALLESYKVNADAMLAKDSASYKGLNIKSMADHYLGLIAQVQAAKEGSYGFGPGTLPRWLPVAEPPKVLEKDPQDELAKLGIKLVSGAALKLDKGALSEDHVLKASGDYMMLTGNWWKMTLLTGEEIYFADGDGKAETSPNGIQLVHHGKVRFFSKDNSVASLERIRAAMQLTGLEMREAEQHDFEQFYWRHMLAMLDDRTDGHSGKQQQVWDELKAQFTVAGMPWPGGLNGDGKHGEIIAALTQLGAESPDKEAAIYRAAFAKLTSDAQVADWAERGGFLPRLKHFDPNRPDVVSGKPDWYRFDLADQVKDLPMPVRQTNNTSLLANRTVKSGGSYGKDALLRVAGAEPTSGMGNPDTSGGPSYVFTRVNQEGQTYFSPLILARSHNYAFSDDSFGKWYLRKTGSSWSSGVWKNYHGGNNEHMVMDALSLLDDVELVQAESSVQRNAMVKWLKDRGITHIRFLPVEDRIVSGYVTSSELQKIKDNWAKHPELLDPLREPEAWGGKLSDAALPPGSATAVKSAQAAQPAATGSEKPAAPAGHGISDPHLEQILQQGLGNGTKVYQPAGNKDIYYVKHNDGSWSEFDVENGALSQEYVPEPYIEEGLNKDAGTSALLQVHPPAGQEGGQSPGTVYYKGTTYALQPGETAWGKPPSSVLYVKDAAGGWNGVDTGGQKFTSGLTNATLDNMQTSGTLKPVMPGAPGPANKEFLDNLLAGAGQPDISPKSYTTASGESFTLPGHWEVYKASPDHYFQDNALWAKDPQGDWWKVGPGSPTGFTKKPFLMGYSMQGNVDNGNLVPADASEAGFQPAKGLVPPADWALYGWGENSHYAKSPEGKWFSLSPLGVISSDQWPEGGGLAKVLAKAEADGELKTEVIKDGKLVAKAKATGAHPAADYHPTGGAIAPDYLQFFISKSKVTGHSLHYAKVGNDYWLVSSEGKFLAPHPSFDVTAENADKLIPAIKHNGKISSPGEGGAPPF